MVIPPVSTLYMRQPGINGQKARIHIALFAAPDTINGGLPVVGCSVAWNAAEYTAGHSKLLAACRRVLLVGDHDPGLAELSDQPLEKLLSCFSVSSRLHKNVEDVPFGVDGTPQLMFLLSNRDNDLIQMPFVVGARTTTLDAICEMWIKAIDPQPDRFLADNHTALGQRVFDVCPTIIP